VEQRKIAFKCYHADCANDPPLEILVEVPREARAARGSKEITKQCERGHWNVITLPDTWNVRPLVLGDDEVIGEVNGVPVVQGRHF
jgi:hypothetical protein